MSTEPPSSPRRSSDSGSWVRPLVLAASCLVLGFVGGWLLRGDGGSGALLPPAEPTAPQTAPPPATTAPSTPPAVPPPPARDTVRLAVLNATAEGGLAGRTADMAEGLGYVNVTAGNAPTESGRNTVYFRPDHRSAARQVASDLKLGAPVQPLPADDDFVAEAGAEAQVIVVLRAP